MEEDWHMTGAALDLDGRSKVMTESQGALDCGEPLASDVDEKILLHGTSYASADAIVTEGFDHRTCHRGLYGDGVYFAGAWCKSHQYTCSKHSGKACHCKQDHVSSIFKLCLSAANSCVRWLGFHVEGFVRP